MDKPFTFGSLFAGIGGFDLGLERAGMQCRWQVEIDPWARRVLAKHWPDVPKFGDIRALTGEELESVDLICGGFPCQPFSLAGEQRGMEDDRFLWPEMVRLVQELQPCWVVGENVPGLVGLGLDAVCADLESAGYEVWTLGIPAVAVGAPHLRERVWIVAYASSQRRQQVAGSSSGDEGANGRGAQINHLSQCDGESRRTRLVGQPDRQGLAVGEGFRGHARPEFAPTLGADWWAVEPEVGRVAHGIPGRVDRLRGLGNAVVPQIPELLGRWILEAEEACAP